MSGRGTITSRVSVSPNSKIEWMRSFSPSSIDSSSEATSAMARMSSSVANGPCGSPLPGRITFAIEIRTRASGPTARVMATISGASRTPTRSVCRTVNVFGVTSAKTNSRIVMATVATISPARCICRTATTLASVVPPSWTSKVSSSTTFRYGAGFSAIRTMAFAPRFPSSRRW